MPGTGEEGGGGGTQVRPGAASHCLDYFYDKLAEIQGEVNSAYCKSG